MDRLTKRNSDGTVGISQFRYYNFYDFQKIAGKLAEYEDLEEQGLLLKVPCKVGDIIYEVDEGILFDDVVEPIECKVSEISIVSKIYINIIVIKGHGLGSTYYFTIEDFGKEVFLTKEEAVRELERLNEQSQRE